MKSGNTLSGIRDGLNFLVRYRQMPQRQRTLFLSLVENVATGFKVRDSTLAFLEAGNVPNAALLADDFARKIEVRS